MQLTISTVLCFFALFQISLLRYGSTMGQQALHLLALFPFLTSSLNITTSSPILIGRLHNHAPNRHNTTLSAIVPRTTPFLFPAIPKTLPRCN
ncbi:hypothetical protein B9Z19DRAFT_1070862, partial [Tuber borchii]